MIDVIFSVIENDNQRAELSDFYTKNKDRLYRIAYSWLHNRESAEDAVQETFLRLAKDPEKFFGMNDNKRVSFANVVVRNVAIDMYKKANKIDTDEISDNFSYNVPEKSPEDELLYKFTQEKLIELLRGLPPLQRDILYLKAVHGMTIQEVAKSLSVSENVVRQRMFCARKSLKDAFRKGGF